MNTIIHIDNSPGVTGAYRALLSWCRSEPSVGHVWVLPEGSAVADEVRKHFTVYTLPFVEIGKSPAKLIKYLPALWLNGRRLKKIIDKEQPALVHANDLYNLVPYAAGLGKKGRLPVVVHARMLRRSFPGKIYDFWKRLHLKKAQAIIAVSEAIKNDWTRSERVQVIYDPIDVKETLPPYSFKKDAAEPFRFLYLANYMYGKGQDDALEAIKALKGNGITGFKVDFYGGTMGLEKNAAYKQALEKRVTELGLEGIVTINDAIADVEKVMKGYHALLHFSHSESFGMVCYEALYYGLPVISSDCGGPAEMMNPGVSGILLPLKEIDKYAAAMQSFIEHPEACLALSSAARTYVRSKFGGSAAQLTNTFAALMH